MELVQVFCTLFTFYLLYSLSTYANVRRLLNSTIFSILSRRFDRHRWKRKRQRAREHGRIRCSIAMHCWNIKIHLKFKLINFSGYSAQLSHRSKMRVKKKHRREDAKNVCDAADQRTNKKVGQTPTIKCTQHTSCCPWFHRVKIGCTMSETTGLSFITVFSLSIRWCERSNGATSSKQTRWSKSTPNTSKNIIYTWTHCTRCFLFVRHRWLEVGLVVVC